MPIKLKGSVRGQRALVANLFEGIRGIRAGCQRQTLATGVAVQVEAFNRAPVDEDFMRQQIRLVLSKGSLAFEVGYYDPDFAEHGDGENYGVHQELGFEHYLTGQVVRNPHIEPAYRVNEPAYRNGIRREVLAAIARMAV